MLLIPHRHDATGWQGVASDDLRVLCDLDLDERGTDQVSPAPARSGPERVLLLTLSEENSDRGVRELAELEGLVRSMNASAG